MKEQHSAKLIAITPNAEKLIAYCARVSSPNQENPEYAKLLAYCIKHSHWSVFEMANMVLELSTTRAIGEQFIRHKSISVQVFSQRYAETMEASTSDFRMQCAKNRQASNDLLSNEQKQCWQAEQAELNKASFSLYSRMLEAGIAKECARNVLPLNTPTKLYANGNIRSWLTYLSVRLDKSTQLEHRMLAESCWAILREQLPVIAQAAVDSGFIAEPL